MTDTPFLYLSDNDLAGLGITTDQITDCLEDAIVKSAGGTVWTAPKAVLQPGDGRYMMTTLSAADDPSAIVVKAVSVMPENPDRGLDTINGAILLFDSRTGLLKSVMDAGWITAVRTAGLSAVAARRLANPQSASIAFVGTGVQARSHLDAFADMFPLTEARISGRGQANIDKLSDHARARGLTATACATPQEALTGADIVVTSITATFAGDPFLDPNWLKPGALAVVTDLGLPWMQDRMDAFSTIVIDDRAQEDTMPKKLAPPALVTADLAQLVSGAKPVAFDPNARAAFVFRGIAIGDFAVAALAYNLASG